MTNLRLLTLISALSMVSVGIMAPLVSIYLESLGANLQQVSWILTSVVATSLIASYLWGRYSDRLGRRKPILVGGLFILSLAFLFLSRADNPSFAWASRVFEGIGSAAFSTLSLAMMGDLLQNDPNKGRRMGWIRGLGSAAFAFGSVSGGWLADHTSIDRVLWLCAGLYFSAGLIALLLQESGKSLASPLPVSVVPSQSQTSSPALLTPEGWTRGLPFLFLLGVVLWVSAHTASASMWPNYMATFGYTKTQSGLLWGLAALIEFPAMWYTGALSDRWGRATLLIVGGLGIAFTNLGYFALAGFFPLLIGVQFVRGIGFGSYTGNAMTFATERGDPMTRGSRSGLFNSVASAGSILGSMLGGTLAQQLGFSALYVTCAMLAFGAAFSFFWLYRQSRVVV